MLVILGNIWGVIMPIIFIIFIIAIIVVAFLLRDKTDPGSYYIDCVESKGELGEEVVASFLSKLEGYIINDYMIKDYYGNTHQIDHIFINKAGVFVIETKYYAGRIYGNDSSKNWTQVLNYGKTKNHFYNPVKQNATHCNQIKRFIKDVPIYNVVVMVDDNTLYIKSNYTIGLVELRNFIRSKKEVMIDEKVDWIYSTLQNHRDTTITKEEHIDNVSKIKYKQK